MNLLSFQHVRAAWAERAAQQHGSVKRTDIVNAFGVSAATASTDIGYLLKHNKGCMEYDNHAQEYRWKAGAKVKLELPQWVKDLNRRAE